jgi:FKBP-type peptidyl-prolyl cis-trans isomerase FkpA
MNSNTRKLVPAVLLVLSCLLTLPVAADEAFRAGPGGLRMKDLQAGQGMQAQEGMVATIHFIGWLDERGARGREIFNSRAEGRPISFVIGTDKVMPAWNAGVLGMRPGGARLLLVPPAMAYGDRAIEDVVPANAPLMMRLELLQLENPDGS